MELSFHVKVHAQLGGGILLRDNEQVHLWLGGSLLTPFNFHYFQQRHNFLSMLFTFA